MAHRQSALMAVSERVGLTRYRFYLQNATGGLLEINAPGGWNGAKYAIKRDTKYWGVTRIISFNDLNFFKAARDYIQDVYEGQGINAIIKLIVDRLDDSTGAYVNYFTGKLDLSTYKIEQIGVQCQVLDTSFAEKIKNRESAKVNLKQLVSIEGFVIPAFATEDPHISFPEYNIQAVASWLIDYANPITTNDDHYVPLLLTISEFTEAQSQTIDGTDPMFLGATAARIVNLSGTVHGIVETNEEIRHFRFRLELWVNGTAIKVWDFSATDSYFVTFEQIIDEDFTVNMGADISMRGSVTIGGVINTTTYYHCNLTLSEDIESVISSSVYAMQFYEALLRTCQIISDSNDCLKSDFFGRTDTPIVTYAADGQLGHITKGLNIRGAIGLNDTLPVTFSELFESLSSVFNLGMAIENISGTDKVVIEPVDYFFTSDVILDLSARIDETMIGKEVIPTRHFSRINVGYSAFEYLAVGGLGEFNTKSEFTTVISVVDQLLDIVSKYRADTQGILLLRREGPTSEDSKGDDNIFMIDSVRQLLSPFFKARTNEDFTLVVGGVDADQNYNLDWTPKRNLLRHGNVIRSGLEKNLGTYLRWQATEKNTTLQTQKTAETSPVVENADVLVNDLIEPFFLPEFYTVECVMYDVDLEAIKTNPKGLIKLAPLKYGWIWDFEQGSEENKGKLKLLRANLNVITPV